MMTKTLCTVMMLGICGAVLSAQEVEPLVPLYAVSTIWYTVPVQPPATRLEKHSVPTKQESTLSVDVPISPFWDTIREDRIKNRTIQFGGSATPWKYTEMFSGLPVLRVIFTGSDAMLTIEGGMMRTRNENISRTIEQVRVALEGATWYVLVGADGFFGQEQIPGYAKGINFEEDFSRHSSGGQAWLGVKVGNFNKNFIAGRYGRGYAWTKGEARFVAPSVGELDWLPLYLEQFRTASLSIESRVRVKRISQSVRLDAVEYERVFPSPDPARFGENHLRDMRLRTETEVIPFSRLRFLRGVVVLTKDFRDQNRLMFFNDYPSVQVFLRIAFK